MAKKKTIPVKVKDPKKVAAGKARAAKVLRVGGKFTSNNFFEKVQSDVEASGIKPTPQNVIRFYQQAERQYTAVYEKMNIPVTRNEDKFLSDLKTYKGRVQKNGKEIKAATLRENIRLMGQYLRTEHDVVTFYLQPLVNLQGKLNLRFPSITEIQNRLDDGEELEDIMDEYDITIVVSSKRVANGIDDTDHTRHMINKNETATLCGLTNLSEIFYTKKKKIVDCPLCKRKM
jgi:hypothetical protein